MRHAHAGGGRLAQGRNTRGGPLAGAPPPQGHARPVQQGAQGQRGAAGGCRAQLNRPTRCSSPRWREGRAYDLRVARSNPRSSPAVESPIRYGSLSPSATGACQATAE